MTDLAQSRPTLDLGAAPGGSCAPLMSKYEARLLAQECTRCGKALAEDRTSMGAAMCERCEGIVRKAQARSKRVKRKARRKAGYCAFCPRKSKRFRCPACRVKLYAQRARPVVPISEDRVSVRSSVDHNAEISRITRDGESDGYARTRYHGQARRGQQPWAQLDDQDLVEAIKALIKARRGLAIARDPENGDVPRLQKQDAVNEALALAAYAVRFTDDVLARNRYDRGEMIETAQKTRR